MGPDLNSIPCLYLLNNAINPQHLNGPASIGRPLFVEIWYILGPCDVTSVHKITVGHRQFPLNYNTRQVIFASDRHNLSELLAAKERALPLRNMESLSPLLKSVLGKTTRPCAPQQGMMIFQSGINMDIRSLRGYAYYVRKHRCSTGT